MLAPLDSINNPIYPPRLMHGERRIKDISVTVAAGMSDPFQTPLGSNQWFIDSCYRFSLQINGNRPPGGVFQIGLSHRGFGVYPYLTIPIIGDADVITTVQDIFLPGFYAMFFITNSDPVNAQLFQGHFILRGII